MAKKDNADDSQTDGQENEIPQDEIPQDEIPQDDAPLDETPEDETPQDDASQDPPAPPTLPDILFGNERIEDLPVQQEMRESYLTYAMSTIMDRALPDVRDGLKPSQRRVLVAMNDLNLGPRSKHRKCAKIAGDTSGNYHPHGEGVVYPTLRETSGRSTATRRLQCDTPKPEWPHPPPKCCTT